MWIFHYHPRVRTRTSLFPWLLTRRLSHLPPPHCWWGGDPQRGGGRWPCIVMHGCWSRWKMSSSRIRLLDRQGKHLGLLRTVKPAGRGRGNGGACFQHDNHPWMRWKCRYILKIRFLSVNLMIYFHIRILNINQNSVKMFLHQFFMEDVGFWLSLFYTKRCWCKDENDESKQKQKKEKERKWCLCNFELKFILSLSGQSSAKWF